MKYRKRNSILTLKKLMTIFFTAGLMLCFAGLTAAANPNTVKGTDDIRKLEGRWVRPDGGYVIELRNIKQDGSVSAAYFNPTQIKVYRAEIKKKNGKVIFFMELRDANYPGSTYNLIYNPESDRLQGTYYQAVHRQTFNVEFLRTR